jgi:hypothetical protein
MVFFEINKHKQTKLLFCFHFISNLFVKEFGHVFHQIVVQAQLPDLFFELSDLVLSLHCHIESLFQCVVLHDQLSDVFFFL